MNYQKHYDQLIESRKLLNRKKSKDEYFERHHISPRCIGGSEEISNFILLTPREHYIAHWLLWKALRISKLAYAFRAIAINLKDKRRLTSKQYERAKLAIKQGDISEETREKMRNRIFTKETREKISNALKGKSRSEETKNKIANTLTGRKRSPEEILNMKNAIRPLPVWVKDKKKILNTKKYKEVNAEKA